MDIEFLKEMINQGMINVTKHPSEELYILNYTQTCQFSHTWNEVTIQCRGLIVDKNFNILYRPFCKFFNIEEVDESKIPYGMNFEVTDKLDGSLGILYWIGDVPYISTRGSFSSDQAIHATEILHRKYSHVFDYLDRNITYLFEIIYPENRIVLDYGQTDDIFLLAKIDTETGYEYSLESGFFQTTKVYDGVTDFKKLRDISLDNKEGFVVKFENGFRVKMKFVEYVRLHKILTNVTSYTIYEYLSEGRELKELLEKVPDEFFTWVKKTSDNLLTSYRDIELGYQEIYQQTDKLLPRREIAQIFLQYDNPGILFSMLDDKDYSKAIWRLLKPDFEKPFSNIQEKEEI